MHGEAGRGRAFLHPVSGGNREGVQTCTQAQIMDVHETVEVSRDTPKERLSERIVEHINVDSVPQIQAQIADVARSIAQLWTCPFSSFRKWLT